MELRNVIEENDMIRCICEKLSKKTEDGSIRKKELDKALKELRSVPGIAVKIDNNGASRFVYDQIAAEAYLRTI